jgi:hypothetical protein
MIRDPSVVQSVQRFERLEINLEGDYPALPDGRRYFDFSVQGDSIYIPPESAPVAVQVYLSDKSVNKNKQIPNLYPGGNVVGLYKGGRITFPATGVGTIIVIFSEGMKFSSGSILLNAPNSVSSYGDPSKFVPYRFRVIQGTPTILPVSAGSVVHGISFGTSHLQVPGASPNAMYTAYLNANYDDGVNSPVGIVRTTIRGVISAAVGYTVTPPDSTPNFPPLLLPSAGTITADFSAAVGAEQFDTSFTLYMQTP